MPSRLDLLQNFGGEREDEWEKELLLLYPLDRIPRHPQATITLNIFGWTLTYMGHKSLTLMYVCKYENSHIKIPIT